MHAHILGLAAAAQRAHYALTFRGARRAAFLRLSFARLVLIRPLKYPIAGYRVLREAALTAAGERERERERDSCSYLFIYGKI